MSKQQWTKPQEEVLDRAGVSPDDLVRLDGTTLHEWQCPGHVFVEPEAGVMVVRHGDASPSAFLTHIRAKAYLVFKWEGISVYNIDRSVLLALVDKQAKAVTR